MAEITAALVKRLRDKTGVGMMDCKAALNEAGGDIDKAEDLLRQKGIKTAERKAGRVANEGKVVAVTDPAKQAGGIVAVRCETDFVVKNERFAQFCDDAAKLVMVMGIEGVDDLKGADMDGSPVEERLKELIGVIGENMSIDAASAFKTDETGRIGYYIHHDGHLGVMLAVTDPNMASLDVDKVDQTIADLCMQVSFTNPVSLDKTGVPEHLVERERAIYLEQVKDKPEQIRDKIVEGKLGKFYQEVCLIDQEFINPGKFKGTVRAMMAELSPTMVVQRYVRFELQGDSDEE